MINEPTDTLSRYFKEVNKNKVLSIEEELELTTKVMNGDEKARQKLIKHNLKFVISVAKEYQNLGLPLSDLINEGNVGLIKASERFNPTRGFKFISYAVWWIKQSIITSLNNNSRVIRLPTNVLVKIKKITKESGVDSQILEDEMSELPTCVSLNAKIDSYSGFELGDGIVDETVDAFELFDFEHTKLKSALNKSLDCLSNKERGIIECYFGLNTDYAPMTLEAIGDKYDLTKERIRQIKEKAIRRLRHNNLDLHKLINK